MATIITRKTRPNGTKTVVKLYQQKKQTEFHRVSPVLAEELIDELIRIYKTDKHFEIRRGDDYDWDANHAE